MLTTINSSNLSVEIVIIPELKTFEKLAKALDVPFEWLLIGKGAGFIARN
jgi:hypothetical protein|tara:strand:- start:5 stop:154 length:150 start_codon:yes stop_codon:yes gene_type:complete